jgi:ATP synthase protein I
MNEPGKGERETTRHGSGGRKQEEAESNWKVLRQTGRGLWMALGTVGLIGWSIAIPPVVGALLGRWIDANWPGPVPWTLVLLLAGLVGGCANVWRWLSRLAQGSRGGDQEDD